MWLRYSLNPDNKQMDDNQSSDDYREDENVQEIHPSDGLVRKAGAAEHRVCHPRSNQWCTVGHVDSNRRRAEGETIPR